MQSLYIDYDKTLCIEGISRAPRKQMQSHSIPGNGIYRHVGSQLPGPTVYHYIGAYVSYIQGLRGELGTLAWLHKPGLIKS